MLLVILKIVIYSCVLSTGILALLYLIKHKNIFSLHIRDKGYIAIMATYCLMLLLLFLFSSNEYLQRAAVISIPIVLINGFIILYGNMNKPH